MRSECVTPQTPVGHYEAADLLDHTQATRRYAARDPRTGEDLVLYEVDLTQLGGAPPSLLEADLAELTALEHPGLEVYHAAATQDEGVFCYTAEPSPGPDFRAATAACRSDDAARRAAGFLELLHIAEGVAAALAHLHGHGIVHLDIRPETIRVPSGAAPRLSG